MHKHCYKPPTTIKKPVNAAVATGETLKGIVRKLPKTGKR